MSQRWTATILLVLGLIATGATLAWACPTAAVQGVETLAISSPAPELPALVAPEGTQPVFAASCTSIYRACLAGCSDDTTCRNKCYCQFLDCIGSEAPCPG